VSGPGETPQLGAGELELLLTEIGRRILARGGAGRDALASIELEITADRLRAMLAAGACRVGVRECRVRALGDLASAIDHTLLRPDATLADHDQLCAEALEYRFASVCIHGAHVRRCAEILQGSGVLVCSVAGFPLGAMASRAKRFEAERALDDGACEIDVVLPIGLLKSGADDLVERDVAGVAEVCRARGGRLKVILETCLLTDDEKVRACRIANRAGADFVKTSTGFAQGGATVEDVALLRRTVGPSIGVKAAGGIRDSATALALLDAGATRIGASASVEIVRGQPAPGSY